MQKLRRWGRPLMLLGIMILVVPMFLQGCGSSRRSCSPYGVSYAPSYYRPGYGYYNRCGHYYSYRGCAPCGYRSSPYYY